MADGNPLRVSLVQLVTGTSIEALSNPPELEEILKANWEEPDVLGLSHRPQEYMSTDNHVLNFTFQLDAYQDGKNRLPEILYFRRFIISLFYPKRGAQTVIGGSPARFLFVWPNFISMACIMHSAVFRHTRFDRQGSPTAYTLEVSVKNVRDVRITSEDALVKGTLRAGGSEDALHNGAL